MIKVGLTGNIGSGKSTACKVFELLGIPIFYSDIEAKKLYSRPEVKFKIEQHLGKSVFNDKYEVDFKKLAAVIFSNKTSLNFINGLIHPLVYELYNLWLEKHHESSYSIHESAILFEHHLENRFDKTIVVYCPAEIRINRVLQRNMISETEVKRRISNQLEDKVKNEMADYVVTNDGIKMLIPQIIEIDKKLRNSIIN